MALRLDLLDDVVGDRLDEELDPRRIGLGCGLVHREQPPHLAGLCDAVIVERSAERPHHLSGDLLRGQNLGDSVRHFSASPAKKPPRPCRRNAKEGFPPPRTRGKGRDFARRSAYRSAMEKVVVIGAGHAGVELANSLRQSGFAGSIVLVNDETDLPYQKPPLSKDFLKGDGRNPLMLKAEVFYTQHDITLKRGRRAVSIDRATKVIGSMTAKISPTTTSLWRSAPATAGFPFRARIIRMSWSSGPLRTRSAYSRSCRRFSARRSSVAASSDWRLRLAFAERALSSISSRSPTV